MGKRSSDGTNNWCILRSCRQLLSFSYYYRRSDDPAIASAHNLSWPQRSQYKHTVVPPWQAGNRTYAGHKTERSVARSPVLPRRGRTKVRQVMLHYKRRLIPTSRLAAKSQPKHAPLSSWHLNLTISNYCSLRLPQTTYEEKSLRRKTTKSFCFFSVERMSGARIVASTPPSGRSPRIASQINAF